MFVTAFLTVMILEGMMNATLSYVIDFQVDDSIHVFGLIVGAATLAGIMQAVRWGVGPIISPLIGGVLDIVRRKHYMLSNFLLLSAIFLLLIPLKIPLMIWLPLLLVNLLLASSITTIVDSMVSNMASKRNHKIMAMTVYTILVDLGAALGPIIGFTFEGIIGLKKLFWVCAAICLVLTAKWMIFTKENKEVTSREKLTSRAL